MNSTKTNHIKNKSYHMTQKNHIKNPMFFVFIALFIGYTKKMPPGPCHFGSGNQPPGPPFGLHLGTEAKTQPFWIGCFHLGVSKNSGVSPQNGRFISWKTLLKWMIWGYHHLRKHPFLVNLPQHKNSLVIRAYQPLNPYFWGGGGC